LANRLMPAPYVTLDFKQIMPYYQYRMIGPHYPDKPTGEALAPAKSLVEFLCGDKEVTPDNIKSLTDKIDGTAFSERMIARFQAALRIDTSNGYLEESLGMAYQTDAYARLFKHYLAGYFCRQLAAYYDRSENRQDRDRSLSRAFCNLLQALSHKHLFTGRYFRIKMANGIYRQDAVYQRFSCITDELKQFNWTEHVEAFLEMIGGGKTVILFADDMDRRYLEGEFLKSVLGLHEHPGNRLVPRGRDLFIIDEEKIGPFSHQIWYQRAETFVKLLGRGRIIYTHLEERPPASIPNHFPFAGVRRKERFRDVLEKCGLLPGMQVEMRTLRPVERPLRWFGPLYSSAGQYDSRYKLTTERFLCPEKR